MLAAFGLISSAPPVFTACARAPLAGLMLALPGLAATGLLATAHATYGATFPNGFYSLDTMLCEGVFRALLGQARAEGATRIDPVALGRVLGLDRAPEVKTIRRKIGFLAAAGRAGHLDRRDGATSGASQPRAGRGADVDGISAPIRAPAGSRIPMCRGRLPCRPRRPPGPPMPPGLRCRWRWPTARFAAAALRRLIPELRATVGDDRRALVGLHRGGWSRRCSPVGRGPARLPDPPQRKTADIDQDAFAKHSHTDEHGRAHTWRLADTATTLDIAEGPRAGEVFATRQISLFDGARTRQMHILTTRTDLPAAQIRYRMGSRWRQENHYRYARIHFDLDSHDTYRAGEDDRPGWCPTRPRNPPTSRSKKPGVHCIRPKPPAIVDCWRHPPRRRSPPPWSPTR